MTKKQLLTELDRLAKIRGYLLTEGAHYYYPDRYDIKTLTVEDLKQTRKTELEVIKALQEKYADKPALLNHYLDRFSSSTALLQVDYIEWVTLFHSVMDVIEMLDYILER